MSAALLTSELLLVSISNISSSSELLVWHKGLKACGTRDVLCPWGSISQVLELSETGDEEKSNKKLQILQKQENP